MLLKSNIVKILSAGGHKIMRRGLVSWDPLRELMRGWEDDLVSGDFVPAIDIFQDKDNVIVEMDAPGLKASDIEITVENDVLTINGSREDRKEVKREDYYRKELRCGSFSRSVILPMQVKGNDARADFEGGILKVVLPKADEVKPKKISVGVNE